MKNKPLFLCLLLAIPFLFAEEDDKPANHPDVLHQTAMGNLELQAEEWDKLAIKARRQDKQSMYTRLAESYRNLKLLREEAYIAYKNEQAVKYEQLNNHKHHHTLLVTEAETVYEIDVPELPEEINPRPQPIVEPSPTPIPEKSYTTKSGFTVNFRLEE